MAYDSDLRRYLVVWEDSRHASSAPDVYGQLYAGHTRIIEYSYDPLYRLSSADYSTGESFSYTYDEMGNRVQNPAPASLALGFCQAKSQQEPCLGRPTGR